MLQKAWRINYVLDLLCFARVRIIMYLKRYWEISNFRISQQLLKKRLKEKEGNLWAYSSLIYNRQQIKSSNKIQF